MRNTGNQSNGNGRLFGALGWLMMLVAILSLLGGGCRGGGDIYVNPSGAGGIPANVPSPDTLQVGQKISVSLKDAPQEIPMHVTQIREDGTITLPLINQTLAVANKRVSQVETEIHNLYVPNYYKRLTVTIATGSRYYTVSGQVRAPGQLVYDSEMTVLKAIGAAGGFNDFGDKKRVQVLRNGKSTTVDCEKALKDPARYDMPIIPGDHIDVPMRYM